MRNFLKKIPGLKKFIIWLRTFFRPSLPIYHSTRKDYTKADSVSVVKRRKLLNLLDYTKTSGVGYAATSYEAGYHKIKIDGVEFSGQRDPKNRTDLAPYDFKNKTILDIGSNQGGMIFALKDQFRWAIGVDYDPRMVNASNLVSREMGISNAHFYVFDIDKDPILLLKDFLPEQNVDIIFLLAVCRWVKEWKCLIDNCTSLSKNMLFESNGNQECQAEQLAYLNKKYKKVDLLLDGSDDGSTRRLYFASNE